MAKAEVKEVTTKALVLELNDRDVEVITSALRLVRDFGDVSDWDDADALRAQILSAGERLMRRFRDRDKDVWTEQSDGSFLLTESEDFAMIDSYGSSLDFLQREYGPLEELTPAPTDLSAPVTRGELADVFESLLIDVENSDEPNYTIANTLRGFVQQFREGK